MEAVVGVVTLKEGVKFILTTLGIYWGFEALTKKTSGQWPLVFLCVV